MGIKVNGKNTDLFSSCNIYKKYILKSNLWSEMQNKSTKSDKTIRLHPELLCLNLNYTMASPFKSLIPKMLVS